jgi:DNA adenine methylase
MTSYHGGKQRIGKKIAEIIYDKSIDIIENENFEIKGYCEPFCGMLGVYRHIHELFKDKKLKYKAGDINKSVILMWKESQKGWYPNINIDKNKYDKLKYSHDTALKGFIGHQCSFGGVYFATFRPERCTKIKLNNALEKVNNIAEDLEDVIFKNGSYKQYSNLKNYIIYCDPPYSVWNRYYDNDYKKINFDHEEFWNWCRKMSKNNIIFISEFKAPKDFKLIYSKKNIVNHNIKLQNNIEKLFMI